jgi:hypothetical protein
MNENQLMIFYFRINLNVLHEDLEMNLKIFFLFDYHLILIHHKMYLLYEKNLEFQLIVFVHNEYNYFFYKIKKIKIILNRFYFLTLYYLVEYRLDKSFENLFDNYKWE